MSVFVSHAWNTALKASFSQSRKVTPNRLLAFGNFSLQFILKKHQSILERFSSLRSHHVVMNTGKYTLVVIRCAFQLTCITATWLPFMTKFAHTTTKHAEKCGAGTTPTALCELVEKHHVSNDLHVYVDFVLFSIYHAIFLFLDCEKYSAVRIYSYV